jgi:hypothetical protein
VGEGLQRDRGANAMNWYWWVAIAIGGWFVAMFTFAMGSVWKDKREQTRAYQKKMAQEKDETL